MMFFRLMTMVRYYDKGKKTRDVFTIASCEGGVSVYEKKFILNIKVVDRTVLCDCDPEIVLLMIQDKHRKNFRIVDYILK